MMAWKELVPKSIAVIRLSRFADPFGVGWVVPALDNVFCNAEAFARVGLNIGSAGWIGQKKGQALHITPLRPPTAAVFRP